MLGLVFVALFVVIGKDFFSTFFGSAFTAGYAPLIIISTGLLLYNIFSISETLLILHKKIRFIFSINLITALLNIVLNILCIHLWGILGAALASAIAINIKGLVTFIYASKNETLLLPYNTLIKSLLSIGVAMLIGYTLKGLSGNPIWVLIIIPGLITSIYVSGLLASHSITKEDRGLLILFIRRLKNRIFIT
jgi:O-antigen/teichoic acid export membrane protein